MNAEVKIEQGALIKLKVPARVIEAARICMAKNDVRYYLNGIRLSSTRISATNGHYLYDHTFKRPITEDGEPELVGDIIFKPQFAVPKQAQTAVFEIHNNFTLIRYYKDTKATDFLKADYAQLIDGKFPDVDKVMGPAKAEPEPVARQRFNISYLAIAEKVFRCFNTWTSGMMVFHGPESVMHIEHDDEETGRHYFLVMPMRN